MKVQTFWRIFCLFNVVFYDFLIVLDCDEWLMCSPDLLFGIKHGAFCLSQYGIYYVMWFLWRKMLCLQKKTTFPWFSPVTYTKLFSLKLYLIPSKCKWSVLFSMCRLLWSVWWSWPRADPILASPWLRPCWLSCTVLRTLPGSWCAIAWPPLPCSCQCWAMECWATSWSSTRLSDDQLQTSSRNFW